MPPSCCGGGTIPSVQLIPSVGSALSAEGVALTQDLVEKRGRFFDEFDWYMREMKAERGKGCLIEWSGAQS